MSEMASTFKITYHREKLESYLRDESIFPATLELDLTSACNRKCPNCPSTTNLPSYNLDNDFIERLFSRLEGETRGLILTGGEPTMAPNFPEILRMARRYGFVDVVVVTNGTFLNEGKVASALLTDASAVRVSMYDWSAESCRGLLPTLKQIEALRSRIDREGSQLQIGVSALTSKENANMLSTVTQQTLSAGAHWIYFHPLCTNWDSGSPLRVDQKDVLNRIEECQTDQLDCFGVFVFRDRYMEGDIEFNEYHATHFLLVIGADGMNYLGAEVKYQRQHIITDVAGNWRNDFLWQSQRLQRIQDVTSRTYPAVGSQHRGVLYNDLVEQFIQVRQKDFDESLLVPEKRFLFPHIL
ncbi:GTP 3',8-cyclase [subsurface metagenome]